MIQQPRTAGQAEKELAEKLAGDRSATALVLTILQQQSDMAHSTAEALFAGYEREISGLREENAELRFQLRTIRRRIDWIQGLDDLVDPA